jgi:hypothetical protein
MTPSGIQLTVNENSELVRSGLQDLDADIPKVGRLGIYRTAQRIVAKMRMPGDPSTSPVNWDSEKQRKAYFASDGFGRGIPTHRSGNYQKGFQIVSLPDGYQVINDEQGAAYIGGDVTGHGQSMIHVGRWPVLANAVSVEIRELPTDVVAELRIAAAQREIEVL